MELLTSHSPGWDDTPGHVLTPPTSAGSHYPSWTSHQTPELDPSGNNSCTNMPYPNTPGNSSSDLQTPHLMFGSTNAPPALQYSNFHPYAMPMHPSYFQHMGYLPSSPSPLQDARSAVLNVPPSASPTMQGQNKCAAVNGDGAGTCKRRKKNPPAQPVLDLAVPEVSAHCGVGLSSALVPPQSNLASLVTSTTILQEALNPDAQRELEV